MPPKPADGLQALLAASFIGVVALPVRVITLTALGRPQRESGIQQLEESIRRDGFVGTSYPLCTLMLDTTEDVTDDNAGDFAYKCIDGNHRIAALKRIAASTGEDTLVRVHLHSPISVDAEQIIAEGVNASAANLVERVLVDNILWYQSLIKTEQGTEEGLGENTIAKKIKQKFEKQRMKPPSANTLKKYVGVACNLKAGALLALKDLTYMPNRGNTHPDRKLFDHKRVTITAITRAEFRGLTDVQQETYIYRLAAGFKPGATLLEKNYAELDTLAKEVAREVSRVEAIVPRACWSPTFTTHMTKIFAKEGSSKFSSHQSTIDRELETYKKNLPPKMVPVKEYTKFLLAAPTSLTVKAFKEDTLMVEYWTKHAEEGEETEQKAKAQKGAFEENLKKENEAIAAEAAKEIAAAKEAAAAAAKAAAAAAEALKVVPTEAWPAASVDSPKTTDTAAKESEGQKAGDATGAGEGKSDDTSKEPEGAKADDTLPKGKGKAKADTPSKETGKRKRQAPAAKIASLKDEEARLLAVRESVSKQVSVNLLDAAGKSMPEGIFDSSNAMLCFLNIAVDPTILLNQPDSTTRLRALLDQLHTHLHVNGTLAIALDGVHSCDFNYMKRELDVANFTLEDIPLLSGYLLGRSGRISNDKKNCYTPQHSETLIAHKSKDFVCTGGGARAGRRVTRTTAAFKLPRTAELEAIGYILSEKHPNPGTFLSASTADHLIQRFSEPGDEILATAADKDEIAPLVLGQGRPFTAFVSDPAKEKAVADQLKAACSLAILRGWFPESNQAPTMVGQGLLPSRVPATNISDSVAREVTAHTEENMDYDDGRESEEEDDLASHRAVASKLGDMVGIEIKESRIEGVGIFASKDLSMDDFVGVPLMGTFEIYDDVVGDVLSDMAIDGIPRYPVAEGELFQTILQSYEVARQGAKLYLQPDPACVLYYMNSSFPHPETTNMSKQDVFHGKGDVKALLLSAVEGVVFKLSRDVKKGEELLFPYPLFPESGSDEQGAEEVEDGE